MSKPTYDSSVARMAGNIAAGLVDKLSFMQEDPAIAIHVDARAIALTSVALARAIVAEVQRTEPTEAPPVSDPMAIHFDSREECDKYGAWLKGERGRY